MDALPSRHLALPAIAVLLALACSASAAAETSAGSAPAGIRPLVPIFSIDARIQRGVRPALEEAARKLSDSRCQEILSDFSDAAGRRLDRNLAATGLAMPGYLGWVVFADGRASTPCADGQVLAWTTPGSRAVSICTDQFASFARGRPGAAANILIHEALHTLGLGESPPDPREITARVQSRCGR